jgi:hypothetical protein
MQLSGFLGTLAASSLQLCSVNKSVLLFVLGYL